MTDRTKLTWIAALAIGAALTGVPAARAMPVAPPPAVSDPAPLVEQAAWPCGPGWRLNRWGRCVPRWGWGPPPRYRRPPPRRYRHW